MPPMPDAPLSWDEAVARVTGPDGRYPLVDATIEGRPYQVFANTPPSLRYLFELASGYGDEHYLVYERKRSTDSAMLALMLRRANSSDAAVNTATSVAPAAIAASSPRSLGTSTG